MYLDRSAGIATATQRDTPKTSKRTSLTPGRTGPDMFSLVENSSELDMLLVSSLAKDLTLFAMSWVCSDGDLDNCRQEWGIFMT